MIRSEITMYRIQCIAFFWHCFLTMKVHPVEVHVLLHEIVHGIQRSTWD